MDCNVIDSKPETRLEVPLVHTVRRVVAGNSKYEVLSAVWCNHTPAEVIIRLLCFDSI